MIVSLFIVLFVTFGWYWLHVKEKSTSMHGSSILIAGNLKIGSHKCKSLRLYSHFNFSGAWLLYFCYAYVMHITLPTEPLMGEECDLGTLIFIPFFYFLPLVLCALSLNKQEDPLTL